eukprot:3814846-Amphidinium_carterae.1
MAYMPVSFVSVGSCGATSGLTCCTTSWAIDCIIPFLEKSIIPFLEQSFKNGSGAMGYNTNG